MRTLSELKKSYNDICHEYVNRFCAKQGLEFTGWVGDFVGDIAYCSDFYFNFSDILLDINTRQPKGLIIGWYYDNLEFEGQHINYYSYIKGLRISSFLNKK